MVSRAGQLDMLARVAKIRADAELKRFAAFRQHFDLLDTQRRDQQSRLAGIFPHGTAFSVSEARLRVHEASGIAVEIARLHQEQQCMRPGFETARQKAVAAFGRRQVLEVLAEQERCRNRRRVTD
ncbi:hypothetical protein [Paracoccus sp. SCSIO 75233]|uniref:hypothetical protein n=1 Tax=Paracoccus sp. SCSIO 75233 TaxID=3017782 RepID=UPI0022F001AE|nr:hypothetical protein [Paracoccus sp. SCSIO 75233]WBU53139.1 hypothetical protein PAF12_15185 [Paracoccus sp. SCSIO 75233]